MKIIGYGICGPGESMRYMRATLEEFKRLCDETIILCNNVGPSEKALIDEYGFRMIQDDREWGRMQWKIKQDFLEWHVSKIADDGDMMVCLDMDEVLDPALNRAWLQTAELDAYHVFIVDLWNDPKHYKPESCFWNVRLWRWNGVTKFKQKPVHCGLAPEWAYYYHRHAPFILKHFGLMKKEDRARKIKRYELYDPDAKWLDKRYYKMLAEDTAKPFDEYALHDTIAKEVATYKQTKPRGPSIYMAKQQQKFAYVRNSAGHVVDIPEKHLHLTLKQPGMTFIGWAEDTAKEMEDLFAESDTDVEDAPILDEGADPDLNETQQADTVLGLVQPDPEKPTQHDRVGVEKAKRPVKRVSKTKK